MAHCDQLKILINLTDLIFVLLLYLLHVHVLLYFCLGNTICKLGMLINLLLLLLLINFEAPLSQLVKPQNKVVRVINNVPLRDHITPHYVNLCLIKLPDIVKVPINPKLLFCLNKYMYNSEQNGAKIFDLGQNRNFL